MSQETARAALASLTDEEATLLNNSPDLLAKFKAKHGLDIPASPTGTPIQQLDTDLKNSRGFFGTANTLLKAPEKMSSQGLNMIANSIPEAVPITNTGSPTLDLALKRFLPEAAKPELTGNLPLDIVKGTPKVLAETAAKVAPGFVSRGAILTAGALKSAKTAAPLIKMIAKGAGSQLESLSGAAPGMTQAAAEAPVLNPIQIQPGRKAASEIYEAGKEVAGKVAPELTKIPGKLEFVQAAAEKADAGTLNPTEALEARKELDLLRKRVTGEFFRTVREKLDAIAKPVFNEADAAYKKGIMADSSRQIMPQNKLGGASAFKTGIITALEAIKREGGLPGKVIGTVGQLSMSPATVGAAATVAGDAAAAAKPFVNNPVATAQGVQLLKNIATGNLPKPYQLKPDIAALQQGIKREAKPLPNPVIPPEAVPAVMKIVPQKKALTIEKVKEYKKRFNNDSGKARAAAIKDGYDPDLPLASS